MGRPMYLKYLVFALIASSAAAVVYWQERACYHHCADIRVSGNIEVTEVRLSFRVPGKLSEVLVSEGDRIDRDQLVAQLDPEELRREVGLRTAEVSVAESMLKELKSGFLPEEIAQTKAKLDQAAADLERQETDFARQQQLLSKDVISKREFDVSAAAYEVAKSRLQEARKALSLMQKGARPEKIEQSEARLQQTQEAFALANTRLEYTALKSPLAGSVLSRNVEPGEYVLPGTPIVSVADLQDVWFRAYISESDLGRVKLHDTVKVRTDSFPGKDYHGKVTFIASEAEFTPKNIQTAEERVKLVYRIKVNLENPNQELKPGMPAEGVIEIDREPAGEISRGDDQRHQSH